MLNILMDMNYGMSMMINEIVFIKNILMGMNIGMIIKEIVSVEENGNETDYII